MKLFCVRDAAAALYMQIFTSQSNGTAIRGFSDEANNQNSPIAAHPADYELYEMGEFDNETGTIVVTTPRSIARAIDYHTGDQRHETQPPQTRQ